MTCSCSKFTKVWAKMQLQGFFTFFVHLLRAQLSNQYLKNNFSSNLMRESGKENSFFEVQEAFSIGAQDGARTNKFELRKFFWCKNQEKIAQFFSKKITFPMFEPCARQKWRSYLKLLQLQIIGFHFHFFPLDLDKKSSLYLDLSNWKGCKNSLKNIHLLAQKFWHLSKTLQFKLKYGILIKFWQEKVEIASDLICFT